MPIPAQSLFTLPVGRHLDGDGLYLRVGESGRRSWQLRLKIEGKPTFIAIGKLPELGLAAARLKAKALRQQALEGRLDRPKQAEPATETPAPDSASSSALWRLYADVMLESGEWTVNHHRRTCAQMQKHLGDQPAWLAPAIELTRPQVVTTCKTIESRETRQRVFWWWRSSHEEAMNRGDVDNSIFPLDIPKELKRPSDDEGSLSGNVTDTERLKAILAASWFSDAALSIRAAHRVCALSGHRIGAVLLSGVEAFNAQADSFAVPRANMKVRDTLNQDDVVISPLSPALREVLAQAQERAQAVGSPWLFPNAGGDAAVLNESVIKHVKRLLQPGEKFTPHSWRSKLTTWALDSGHNREVVQAVLDHARGTSSDQAYDASTLPAQRSALLIEWAEVLA